MTTCPENEYHDLYETLCAAARLGGSILREHFGKQKDIMYKGRINPVTNVDLQSEKAIIDLIKSRYPDHDIITEESHIELMGSPFRWIIDPLDGTVNYAHDYPFVSVSVALEIDGRLEIGAVFDPVREEFFSARRGHGAQCNGKPISVSKIDSLEKSLLATGFSYDIRENPYNNLAHFSHLIMSVQGIRRDGSAALNLCYSAMGRFDGYWELSISPWDIAAGTLITTEAGGTVTNLRGEPLSIYMNQIVATNGKIHDELVGHIRHVDREQYNMT
ncbi:inositol monophosphatase [bacterium]|nr:inositol monophosphatase [bacterium]